MKSNKKIKLSFFEIKVITFFDKEKRKKKHKQKLHLLQFMRTKS